MSRDFQTAVRPGAPMAERYRAVDRLSETGRYDQLCVLVQADGLAGELRRHALVGLRDSPTDEQLERLADDRSVHPALRRRAQECLQ